MARASSSLGSALSPMKSATRFGSTPVFSASCCADRPRPRDALRMTSPKVSSISMWIRMTAGLLMRRRMAWQGWGPCSGRCDHSGRLHRDKNVAHAAVVIHDADDCRPRVVRRDGEPRGGTSACERGDGRDVRIRRHGREYATVVHLEDRERLRRAHVRELEIQRTGGQCTDRQPLDVANAAWITERIRLWRRLWIERTQRAADNRIFLARRRRLRGSVFRQGLVHGDRMAELEERRHGDSYTQHRLSA